MFPGVLVFDEPYHSLLFHFSFFSVVAFQKKRLLFCLMLDLSLLLLSGEHEDDRDTLCMVPG